MLLRGDEGRDWTTEQLDEASARGSFPQRPSDLFLKVRMS